MTSVKHYSEWNPYIYSIETDQVIPQVGSTLTFQVQLENGREAITKHVVTEFVPPNTAELPSAKWVYRFENFIKTIGMVSATRTQELKTLPNGNTAYSTTEVFSGWGSRLVPLERVQRGFVQQAKALKRHCEANLL